MRLRSLLVLVLLLRHLLRPHRLLRSTRLRRWPGPLLLRPLLRLGRCPLAGTGLGRWCLVVTVKWHRLPVLISDVAPGRLRRWRRLLILLLAAAGGGAAVSWGTMPLPLLELLLRLWLGGARLRRRLPLPAACMLLLRQERRLRQLRWRLLRGDRLQIALQAAAGPRGPAEPAASPAA